MLFRNFVIFSVLFASVYCGGGGKKHEIKIDIPKRIHTIHHHHIQKYTVIKKIEVPVIKEVKVPYKVYVYEKVPYKFYVKPLIVKVPIEYYNTKEEKHEEHGHEEHSHESGDQNHHH